MDSKISKVDKKPIKEKLVYLSHMALSSPLASVIQSVEGRNITIVCSQPVLNILVGDPVICKYLEDETEFVLTCDTTDVIDQNTIRVLTTHVEKHSDNRKHARYAVSMNAVIVGADSLHYNCSTVKSLSHAGAAINCKFIYELQSMVVLNIITSSDDVVNVTGKVVRKNSLFDYFEYGIEFLYIDPVNKEKLESFLKKAEAEEKLFLKKAVEG